MVRLDLDDGAEVPDGPLVPVQVHVGDAQVAADGGVARVKVDDPGIVRYRQLVLLQAGAGQPPGREGFPVVRVEGQGAVQVPHRLIVAAQAAQGDSPAPYAAAQGPGR